jgi:S-formylglutathione hydrolase FrmB
MRGRAAGLLHTLSVWAGVSFVGLLGTGAHAQSPAVTIGVPATDGARMVAVEVMDERIRDLTIESPAVGTVHVRLLLPAGHSDASAATFPVLTLLHGGGGDHLDWTELTDVEAFTAPTDLLVAMPAAASSKLGTRVGDPSPSAGGLEGPPDWETFHLVELRELLERNWQASDERVVAGLSLGGYAAVMYAARHPGLFRFAASYSGVLDVTVGTADPEDAQALAAEATELAEASGWDEANPINLVAALDGTPLYVSFGDGEPGPLDPPGTDRDALEAWVGAGADQFVAALDAAGIAATVHAYGPGTHSWPYWDRELEASLPLLLDAVGP